jgi:predicted NodU family carbamoyl transferase
MGSHSAVFARLARRQIRSWRGPSLLRQSLRDLFDGIPLPRIHFIPHHLSHLHAAASSPFQPDGAIIVDGRGEYAATSMYSLDDSQTIRCLATIPYPHSLGVFFGSITQLLGYSALSDEYKVMGLSGYGRKNSKNAKHFAHYCALIMMVKRHCPQALPSPPDRKPPRPIDATHARPAERLRPAPVPPASLAKAHRERTGYRGLRSIRRRD